MRYLCSLLIAFFLTPQTVALTTSEEHIFETCVYKTVGDLEINADVYHYKNDEIRPALVWIHGGALINGHRASIDRRVLRMALDNGFVLVSIDYRLAPETKLPDIITDVEDAFRWLREEGPTLFHIDRDRIAVAGGSAGGYLTLMCGYRVIPRPKALIAFWGYGDLIGDWYTKPSQHPRHQLIRLSREDAWKQVTGPPVSDSRLRRGNGGAFYQYCRQNGTWPVAVTGWDPNTDSERFFDFMPVKNVDSQYPPTLLIHGTDDTDVPHDQSELMVDELKKHGVVHELISIEGGEHGLRGGDWKEIGAAYERAFEFLDLQLSK